MDIVMLCAGLIVFGLTMYIILDGFDLGVGILFPWAPNDNCRNMMMSSIAPVWDGNGTWLIYGGGVLFAAFPGAYAILMPALYIPIMLLILALIFRGVAFEFRLKSTTHRWVWDYSFTLGSTLAAFSQGVILGAMIEGFTIVDKKFAGGAFDCFSSFAITTGFALIIGYALLGSTWTVMKTQGLCQDWAKSVTKPIAVMMMMFILMVSLKTPIEYPFIAQRWFSMPNILLLSPVPLITLLLCYKLFASLSTHKDSTPFFCTVGLFLMCLLGLGISLFPFIVMPSVTIWDAAAPASSLKLLAGVICVSLPIILGYTYYVYKLFKGKIHETEHFYQ